MGFLKEIKFEGEQEKKLREICNNDEFIKQIANAASKYKTLVDDEEESEIHSRRQAEDALDAVKNYSRKLLDELVKISNDDHLESVFLSGPSDCAFLGKVKEDLAKLEIMAAITAERELPDISFRKRTSTRLILVGNIVDILRRFKLIPYAKKTPPVTRKGIWNTCLSVALDACREAKAECLNDIRKYKKMTEV